MSDSAHLYGACLRTVLLPGLAVRVRSNKTQETSRIGIPAALEQEARMRACPTTRVALVIEDEWLVRATIVSELKERGWTVVETATGEDALALLAGCEVDVVLTDIQLAGPMDGWQVAHAVRTANPGLPVIYASANASDPLRRVAGSMFFGKPYDPVDVVAACHCLTSVESSPSTAENLS
jgi:CheY-like chemotaxis protein